MRSPATATTTKQRSSRGTKRRLASFAASLLLASVGMFGLNAAPAQAGYLGGVNMEMACLFQYGVQWNEGLFGNDVMSWKCVDPTCCYLASIDVDRACRTQYNNINAFALYSSYHNPYSWFCAD
ncbi:hypothetical protein O7606_18680 [Micromonospora sp. WMMD882]|uniref:hypothetical protein n=1 Tax=Micromonospora sp. WMMD882 TaxID=3015151 RepID=UPI00248B1F7D|nr:hypothetical protein [Micromonospora sp. WMMD882]WBB78251.1 hypothetical protein O7606_18680 [Micromonospora sp. WMMD882]